MKADWIAERLFDCEPAAGQRFGVIARVGRPILSPIGEKLSVYGRCPVSMAPLVPEQWVGGEDQFQALCLALNFIRMALKAFVAEGGRVYHHGTKNPIDLDDPSFLPLATLEDLRGRRRQPTESRRRKTVRLRPSTRK
jgi:hypothetical protein